MENGNPALDPAPILIIRVQDVAVWEATSAEGQELSAVVKASDAVKPASVERNAQFLRLPIQHLVHRTPLRPNDTAHRPAHAGENGMSRTAVSRVAGLVQRMVRQAC